MALALGIPPQTSPLRRLRGPIKFHDWIGDSWAVLFSHPKDFTPVCTTELGYMAKVKPEFDGGTSRSLAFRSMPPATTCAGRTTSRTRRAPAQLPHHRGRRLQRFEAVRDAAGHISGDAKARTAADNQTVRNVFVIGPDKKIKLILVYPMTTGRNFDEVLRVIDSLQLTAKHQVATPVNWQQGEDVIIAGSVSNDDAKQIWPEGWESPKPYIRIVPDPTS